MRPGRQKHTPCTHTPLASPLQSARGVLARRRRTCHSCRGRCQSTCVRAGRDGAVGTAPATLTLADARDAPTVDGASVSAGQLLTGAPKWPLWQRHEPSTQWPCSPQPPSHTRSLQSVPVQPPMHVHSPIEVSQAPRAAVRAPTGAGALQTLLPSIAFHAGAQWSFDMRSNSVARIPWTLISLCAMAERCDRGRL